MKKQDLVIAISERSKTNMVQVENVLDALKDIVLEKCKDGDNGVAIPKLGRFRGYLSKQRKCYNLHSKKHITVPPTRTIRFKLFPSAKSKLNS